MTEAAITQKLLTHLRKALPAAVVIKTSDRVTKGVPDVYVAYDGRSTWLEVKVLRKGETPATRVSKPKDRLQLFTMQRLQEQTAGCAWYVIYDDRRPSEKHTLIYAPLAIMTNGCVAQVPGFDHQAVVRLLEAL